MEWSLCILWWQQLTIWIKGINIQLIWNFRQEVSVEMQTGGCAGHSMFKFFLSSSPTHTFHAVASFVLYFFNRIKIRCFYCLYVEFERIEEELLLFLKPKIQWNFILKIRVHKNVEYAISLYIRTTMFLLMWCNWKGFELKFISIISTERIIEKSTTLQ